MTCFVIRLPDRVTDIVYHGYKVLVPAIWHVAGTCFLSFELCHVLHVYCLPLIISHLSEATYHSSPAMPSVT